jgi:GTPase SAR1 family protein
MQQVNKREYK